MGKELELAIKIGGKIDKSLGSAVNNAQRQLNALGNRMNKIATVGTAAVVAYGSKLVKDSVQTYQGYQSALNSAAATAGIERGTAEYEAMNIAVREAGRTTVKTAEESANALEYMALAGWSVEDSTKALMPVLKLSASTNAELATTSDLVTDSMANLGLGIDDLNHYLDVSATANNKSNQTAMQLQEAYLGVGGVLKNLNSPIEESAAVLGVLANRGTKGSEAGTALNAILVNMQKRSGDAYKAMSQLGVSMYDTNGNARSIIDVFQEISNKTSDMTEENRNLMYQMIGGKSHLDSFAKIMQGFTTDTADGTKEVYSLIDAFLNCDGALDKLYGIKTDTLEGSTARLNSAFDDMKISIGERVAPMLQGLYDNMTEKMPQIGNIITSALQSIIPMASNVLNFIVNNIDKIVSGAIKFTKTFAAFKLTTGTIKGIESIVTLVKNLSKISSKVGGVKVLQGIIGTFTGIGTAAGTAGGAVTGFTASIAASVAPLAPVGAALAAIAGAFAIYEHFHNKKLNYAQGMNEQAQAIGKATDSLTEYNKIAVEVAELRGIIHNDESSTAQIERAKERLQEIADMFEQEYDLVINADTTSLENAVNMAQQLSRTELINSSTDLIKQAQSGAEQYRIDASSLPDMEQAQQYYRNINGLYKDLTANSDIYYTALDNGLITQERWLSNIEQLYQQAKEAGLQFNTLGEHLDMASAHDFIDIINGGEIMSDMQLEYVNSELERANKNMKEFDDATSKAGDYLTKAFASDVQAGNVFGADTDMSMLEQLGTAMVEAGKSTSELASKYSAAKIGYTEFAEAINDGKAQDMAQNFIDYEKSIGETVETAVQGAALITNGFESVAQATEAGDEAINNVINDIKSLGDAQNLFDGIDTPEGIADKLNDMAHAIGLIPDNKSVTFDVNGNFTVIEDAENQIENLSTNVTMTATDNVTPEANAAETAVTNIPESHETEVNIIGNALSEAGSISNAIDNLPKSKDITINIKTNGSIPKAAKGITNTAAGYYMLNDQTGISDPREVIETRSGVRYYYEGKNVIVPLQWGSTVYTAAQSRAFINGSHADGLDRVPFDGYIAELHEGEQVLTSEQAEDYAKNGLFARAVNSIKELFGKDSGDGSTSDDNRTIVFSPNIYVSGDADEEKIRQAAKLTYRDFEEFMERYDRDRRRKSFDERRA